ncbi:hypothetical protein ACGFXC_32945 [Streptomyces sp. NPDC048507]|uniref:hypothetical protein n=1 Tax=Streptomyces sp. NPDC048507 TaxID=3365560 RepID=UPI00371A3771
MMVVTVEPADLDQLDALVTAQQDNELRWQASAEATADVPTCGRKAATGSPAGGNSPPP